MKSHHIFDSPPVSSLMKLPPLYLDREGVVELGETGGESSKKLKSHTPFSHSRSTNLPLSLLNETGVIPK